MIAPHPDDETLGCGATIARKRAAGTTVVVVACTDGRHSSPSAVISPSQLARLRGAELVLACEALGVEGDLVIQLGYQDGRLADHESQLADRLEALCTEFDPDEILVTSALDHHPDHQAASRAVRRLARDGRIRSRVAEYPIHFWADGPWPPQPAGCGFAAKARNAARGLARSWHLETEIVPVAGNLPRKLTALSAHASQTTNVTGEPTWVRLEERFLANFRIPQELFFPFRPEPPASGAGRGGAGTEA